MADAPEELSDAARHQDFANDATDRLDSVRTEQAQASKAVLLAPCQPARERVRSARIGAFLPSAGRDNRRAWIESAAPVRSMPGRTETSAADTILGRRPAGNLQEICNPQVQQGKAHQPERVHRPRGRGGAGLRAVLPESHSYGCQGRCRRTSGAHPAIADSLGRVDKQHIAEPGLVLLELAAGDEETPRTVMDGLQQRWATSESLTRARAPGWPGCGRGCTRTSTATRTPDTREGCVASWPRSPNSVLERQIRHGVRPSAKARSTWSRLIGSVFLPARPQSAMWRRRERGGCVRGGRRRSSRARTAAGAGGRARPGRSCAGCRAIRSGPGPQGLQPAEAVGEGEHGRVTRVRAAPA
jgi:hypothetical protein